MLGSPYQNDVVERLNQKLINMVWIMISNSNFLLSLWSEALENVAYLLNKDPIKVAFKTPFELWKS